MKLEYQYRSLDKWPFEQTANRRSKLTFKAGFNDTLELLAHELNLLKAERIVFQVVIDAKHLRIDGTFRAGAPQPSHPGVIVAFDSRTAGPLSFPCDSCMLWHHNLRSIALGLASLRAVDRYGVTKRAEQYKGWAALPSPQGDGALWKVPTSLSECRDLVTKVFGFENGFCYSDAKVLEYARQGQRQFHPDQADGDARMSRAFNAAVSILEKAV